MSGSVLNVTLTERTTLIIINKGNLPLLKPRDLNTTNIERDRVAQSSTESE